MDPLKPIEKSLEAQDAMARRAQFGINATPNTNRALAAQTAQFADRIGVPFETAKLMDNNEQTSQPARPSPEDLSWVLNKYADPRIAEIYGDESGHAFLKELGGALEDLGLRKTDNPMKLKLQKDFKEKGFSLEQTAQLIEAGWKFDSSAKKWMLSAPPSIQTEVPLLPQWYQTEGQTAEAEDYLRAVSRIQSIAGKAFGNTAAEKEEVLVANLHSGILWDLGTLGLRNLDPAFCKGLERWNDREYTKTPMEVIADMADAQEKVNRQRRVMDAMGYIERNFPGYKFSKDEATAKSILERLRTDYPDFAKYASDVTPEDLASADWAEGVGTGSESFLNLFGIKTLVNDLPRQMLADINAEAGVETPGKLESDAKLLKSAVDAKRGQTAGNMATAGTLNTLAFLTELYATGGLAGAVSKAPVLAQEGILGKLGALGGRLLSGIKSEVKRTPALLPKNIGQGMENYYTRELSVDDQGDIQAVLADKSAVEEISKTFLNDFSDRAANHFGFMVEKASLGTVVSYAAKKRIAESVLTAAAKSTSGKGWSAFKAAAGTIGEKTARFKAVTDWNGMSGQWFEEDVAHLSRYLVSQIGLDLGAAAPVVYAEDDAANQVAQRFWALAPVSVGMGIGNMASRYKANQRLVASLDESARINKAVNEEKNFPYEAKRLVREDERLNTGIQASAQDIQRLFQNKPEMVKNLNLSESDLALLTERAKEGGFVTLNLRDITCLPVEEHELFSRYIRLGDATLIGDASERTEAYRTFADNAEQDFPALAEGVKAFRTRQTEFANVLRQAGLKSEQLASSMSVFNALAFHFADNDPNGNGLKNFAEHFQIKYDPSGAVLLEGKDGERMVLHAPAPVITFAPAGTEAKTEAKTEETPDMNLTPVWAEKAQSENTAEQAEPESKEAQIEKLNAAYRKATTAELVEETETYTHTDPATYELSERTRTVKKMAFDPTLDAVDENGVLFAEKDKYWKDYNPSYRRSEIAKHFDEARELVERGTVKEDAHRDNTHRRTYYQSAAAAAALRKDGAPNTAEKRGNIRDGNVPHSDVINTFLPEGSKGVYADYEHLKGRHSEYAETQEMARAMTEFVLADPEFQVDKGDHYGLIRRDETTGKAYLIKMGKSVKAGRAHIRSVYELTESQYQKEKSDSNALRQLDEGANRSSLQEEGYRHIPAVSDFLRYDNTGNGKVKSEPEKVYQNFGDKNRGMTTFGDFGSSVITLFKGSDSTTMLHEMLHAYMNYTEYLKSGGVLAGRMLDVYDAVTKFSTLANGKIDPERGAKAFEQYILQGRAPSQKLALPFYMLARDFARIYAQTKGYFKDTAGETILLNRDIARAFDLLLASDAEISSARADSFLMKLLSSSNLLGATEDERKAYTRLLEDARREAAEKSFRERLKAYKTLEREWRAEAKAKMASMPEYKLIRNVAEQGGFSAESASRRFTVGELADLRAKKLIDRQLKAEDGVHLGRFSAEQGFNSEAEMVAFIKSVPAAYTFIEAHAEKRRAEYEERHPVSELLETEGKVFDVIDQTLEVLAKELGKETRQQSKELYRAEAAAYLESTPVSAIKSRASTAMALKHTVKEAAKANGKGDSEGVFDALNKARILAERLRLMRGYTGAVEKFERKAKRIAAKRIPAGERAKVAGDYLVNAQRILADYGFTERIPDAPSSATVETLLSEIWLDVELPVKSPYKKLTYSDFQTVADVVNTLYGVGREKVAEAEEGFKSERIRQMDEINQTAAKHAKYTLADSRESGTLAGAKDFLFNRLPNILHTINWFSKRIDGWKNVGKSEPVYVHFYYNEKGELKKAEKRQWMSEAEAKDGGWVYMGMSRNAGPAERYLYRPMFDANIKETAMVQNVTAGMEPHFKHLKKRLAEISPAKSQAFTNHMPDRFREVQNGLLRPDQMLAMILNLGNLENKNRLMKGFGLDDRAVKQLKSFFETKEDWDAVQGIWDGLASLKGELAAAYKRMYYHDMRLVDAAPFEVTLADGSVHTVKGGYYPAVYDSRTGGKERDEIKLEGEGTSLITGPSNTMTLSRKPYLSGNMLKLDLGVIGSHLEETAHFIAFGELARTVGGMFRSEEFRNNLIRSLSRSGYEEFHKLIKNTFNPDAFKRDQSPILDAIRKISVANGLWWNFSSAAMQVTSAHIGINEIGFDNYCQAAADITRGKLGVVKEMEDIYQMSDYMRNRRYGADMDFRKHLASLTTTNARDVLHKLQNSGYWLLQMTDAAACAPLFLGAFRKRRAELMRETNLDPLSPDTPESIKREAVRYADSLIATTGQGSPLRVDMSSIQLSAYGKMVAMFFTAVNSFQNRQSMYFHAFKAGELSPGEYISSSVAEMVYGAAMSAVIRTAVSGAVGGSDETAFWADFWSEFASYPVQGIPLVRDFGANAVRISLGLPVGRNMRVSPIQGIFQDFGQLQSSLQKAVDAEKDGAFGNALYEVGGVTGSAMRVPVKKVFDRLTKAYQRYNEEDSK